MRCWCHIYTIYDQEEKLQEREYEKILNPINISFKKDNKQRFSDWSNEFFMTLEDEEFIKKIDNWEISFSKTDKLYVQVKEIQNDINWQLKTEYIITKVNKHISVRQERLL